MKDSKGIEICKGDTVVVARRRGSSQWLDVRTVDTLSSNGKPVLATPTRSHTRNGKPSKEYVVYLEYKGASDAIIVMNPVTRIELDVKNDPDKFAQELTRIANKSFEFATMGETDQDSGDEDSSPFHG